MKAEKMKICGTETLDNPAGVKATQKTAERFARSLLSPEMKSIGFKAYVVRGSRGWVLNIAK